jgi:hypothetical protein
LSILDNAAHDSFRLLGLLRRPLLSFLLSVPAREVQSAHCPESFLGSPIIQPESLVEWLDLEKFFGRNAPLHVDLGCGDGLFLCTLAQRMPETNFLGIVKQRLSFPAQRSTRNQMQRARPRPRLKLRGGPKKEAAKNPRK